MISGLKNRFKAFVSSIYEKDINYIKKRMDDMAVLQAKNILLNRQVNSFPDAELQVFSQFGDDGLIQYLIENVNIESKRFIEFGVENYTESNTRFLLINDQWKGLIMDGSDKHINFIQQSDISWRNHLTSKAAFVTAENINQLIEESGFAGKIGILHVDIDGVDYWVWKAINVVDADIVIMEYNSNFGYKSKVTVPYNPSFYRTDAHYSNLYWGASLACLHQLGQEKGYELVGCNKGGNNAYFVKKEKIGNLKVYTPEEAFEDAVFRESKDQQGNMTFLAGKDKWEAIKECEVFELDSQQIMKLKELEY